MNQVYAVFQDIGEESNFLGLFRSIEGAKRRVHEIVGEPLVWKDDGLGASVQLSHHGFYDIELTNVED